MASHLQLLVGEMDHVHAASVDRPRPAAEAENAVVTAPSTDDYELDSDLVRMDLDRVHQWLTTDAYWALGRTRETVETAARHSLNFGVFMSDGTQVAYARVVTDYATFAWLCDVYVDRAHRGRGLAVEAERSPRAIHLTYAVAGRGRR